MRASPAGDFDYERRGAGYAVYRRPEPAFADAIRAALGDVRTVINVGAGAGSYEPTDLDVTPVEPSAVMRAQRPAHLAPAVDAVAEDLPFPDRSFDAGLATFTIHQWPHLARGLRELRRVTRGPIVIMSGDPSALRRFWLTGYAPEMMHRECDRMPDLDEVGAALGGDYRIDRLPIPLDCADGFAEAFYGRPEALLDPAVRAAQSAWSFVGPAVEERSVARLAAVLASGEWDARYSTLRTDPTYDGSVRLVIAGPARAAAGR